MARRHSSIAGAALVAFVLALPAWAQEGRKSDFSSTVTIQEVDRSDMRLVVDDEGVAKTVFAETKTKILDGSRRIDFADLMRGTRVAVDATFEGPSADGRLVADRIVVVREPAAPPS